MSSNLNVGIIIGVISVSSAAIFIRLADAPPLVIASYRMAIGASVMLGIAMGSWYRHGTNYLSHITKRDMPIVVVSAICLSMHFWAWILSLEYTSVASSVVLVTTSPFILSIASKGLFKEPIHKYTVIGIGIGIVGGGIIAIGDSGNEAELTGDLLAFLGALSVAGYMLAGRRLRSHVPALTYNSLVYTTATFILFAIALIMGASFTGYSSETYLWILILGLVPQAIGHSLLNWSLAHVTATTVAIAVMAEPVLATGAAAIFLSETPSLPTILGGFLILSGIYTAIKHGRTQKPGD